MKYIFVRHGKTHFNEIQLKQGWCDSPLTKQGIKEILMQDIVNGRCGWLEPTNCM